MIEIRSFAIRECILLALYVCLVKFNFEVSTHKSLQISTWDALYRAEGPSIDKEIVRLRFLQRPRLAPQLDHVAFSLPCDVVNDFMDPSRLEAVLLALVTFAFRFIALLIKDDVFKFYTEFISNCASSVVGMVINWFGQDGCRNSRWCWRVLFGCGSVRWRWRKVWLILNLDSWQGFFGW